MGNSFGRHKLYSATFFVIDQEMRFTAFVDVKRNEDHTGFNFQRAWKISPYSVVHQLLSTKPLHLGAHNILLAQLHGDLFSRHASPIEVYVFTSVDERGEHVMSDEICRRWNGKQQGRRRGGRSVQLPDSFMIWTLLRNIHTRIRTYYTYNQIYPAEKKAPSEVRSRDGHEELVCKNSGCIS